MSKEAMKLALEALQDAILDYSMGKGAVMRHTKAIKALEDALAKQEQGEPVAIHRESGMTADELWLSNGKLRAEIADLKEFIKRKKVPVKFCKVLSMDDVAHIVVNSQSMTPPYEINYMTVMQLTEQAVLEKFNE